MKQNKEIWRDIPGYEGYYQVSNQGRVRSLDRWVIYKNGRKCFYKGRFFEDSLNLQGYKQVTLSRDGKQRGFKVSQLVSMAFLDHEPNGHSLIIDHIDGDRTNDNVDNLRIVTNRDNTSTCHRSDRNTFTSDFVGVSFSKANKKFRAQIVFKNKVIYLGYFENELEASDAYQKALGELENGTFKIEDYKVKWTSKFKGVTFHKASQKWVANPTINGKRTYLGIHTSELEAYQVILEYEAIQPIEK